MSEFQASNFKKENGGTPDFLGKTELTSPYFFVPPSGDTASRPQNAAPGANTNRIDYVNIATTGDAVDFGDQVTTARNAGATSNAHGGL